MASKSATAPEIKLRLRIVHGDGDAFGPGKAQLLESLLETASLNRTAGAMKMSYMKALALVRAMNTHFAEPLVALTRGGPKGGGAQVTETGRSGSCPSIRRCARRAKKRRNRLGNVFGACSKAEPLQRSDI